MIDDFIMSKPLLALVRFCGVVMDGPWGPHFGLTLTMSARPSEILLRLLVKPSLPANTFEILKPKEVIKTVIKVEKSIIDVGKMQEL